MTSTVLVTSTGGQAATSLMLALKDEPVRLLACDADPCAPGLHNVPPDQRFIVHPSDNPEFIGDLLALCVRCGVDVLVPTGERDFLPIACARDLFEQLGTRVLLAPASELQDRGKEQRLVAACKCEPSDASSLFRRMWGGMFGARS